MKKKQLAPLIVTLVLIATVTFIRNFYSTEEIDEPYETIVVEVSPRSISTATLFESGEYYFTTSSQGTTVPQSIRWGYVTINGEKIKIYFLSNGDWTFGSFPTRGFIPIPDYENQISLFRN